MFKFATALTAVILLTGCTITVKHEVQPELLTKTESKNEVVLKECDLPSLNALHEMEKIDVASYKENNDVEGLLKAAFDRLKVRRDYVELIKLDIKRCKQ